MPLGAKRRRAGRRLTQNAMAARAGQSKEHEMAMDVVDYEIKGPEMQFVEVELDPGAADSMMFMVAYPHAR
jgi:hypothetical protein